MPWGGAGGKKYRTSSYSSDFEFISFGFKCILVLLARRSSGKLRCSGTALIFWSNCLHMSMNVSRSHDVIFKRILSIIKSLDDGLRFYIPFNHISVISGQWKGKHERPCAMKRR